MTKATSRWKSVIDTIHEVEHYWRGTSGPVPWLFRTTATLGRLTEICFWEKDDPYHWSRSQGYQSCFEKTGSFVSSALYEHTRAEDWELVHRTHEVNLTREVRMFHLQGQARVFLTVDCFGDGRRCTRETIFTDHPQCVEAAFRGWWWETLENSVFVSANRALYGAFRSHKMALKVGDYVGPMDEEELHAQWMAYAAKGFHRSLLFIGPPGTGKTTVAKRLAQRKGGPMLRIDPYLFDSGWDPSFVIDIMKLLQPSVLLLDDIHTLNRDSLSGMLHSIEWINNANDSGALVIATANKMSAIDEALRRPGRFDEAILFDAPRSAEARKEILLHYADVYDCREAMVPLLEKIAQNTEQITPAYLQELVKTVCALGEREDIEQVLTRKIGSMAALIKRGSYWDDDEDRRMVEEGFAKVDSDKSHRIGFTASRSSSTE